LNSSQSACSFLLLLSLPTLAQTVQVYIIKYILFAVCLRIQTNPVNGTDFKGISPERAFADFIFASVVLHLVVMNFIG
jgi:hypothetical protein